MLNKVFYGICVSFSLAIICIQETVASCPYSNQFQCSSGQCITKKWVCDGIMDCEDRSDERDCRKEKCTSSQFTCPINQKCIPNNRVCDGGNDCGDNSDEHNCDNYLSQTCMRNGDLWCYNTSKCVSKDYICDGIKHCPDNSDEKECTCMTFQYKCSISGECIHRDWLCDGSKDCPRGDDENESFCITCRPNQFKCKKLKVCVPNEFRCNGLSECSDLSDEKNCLSINEYGLLTSVYQNQSGYLICSDGWLNEHSDAACRNMGYSRSIRFNAVYQNSAKSLRNFEGKFSDGTDFLANFKPSSNCPNNRYVELSCYTQECGKRDASFDLKDTYIRNGFIAKDSAWPWQIQLYKNIIEINETLFSCGGTILSERWILTAAHCLFLGDEPWKKSVYRIQVGTNGLFDKRFKELTVDEVKLFQYNSSVAANDIALIKLSEPLTFNKTVQPICLAQPNIVETYDVCVLTGHGRTEPANGKSKSQLLLQGKMNVMTHSECLASYVEILQRSENEFNVTYEKQFCAGLMPAFRGINPMEGDSGGPLMCRNSRFQWTQIGVVSYCDDSKIDYCPISVFTRVSYYYKALMEAMK